MKLKSAWLVTWEWIGDHAVVKEEEKVVALVNYRRGGEYVKDVVEHLYIAKTSSPVEKATYARNPNANPYRAQFDTRNGIPWQGRIHCGHNPWLYARLVSNVRTVNTAEGEVLRWDERSLPVPH
ncbi:MAG: hypothetical protein LCH73_06160 [Proteobacteria bacterium]|nr:hypothetical protein [Pseudomonadota bacterium]